MNALLKDANRSVREEKNDRQVSHLSTETEVCVCARMCRVTVQFSGANSQDSIQYI